MMTSWVLRLTTTTTGGCKWSQKEQECFFSAKSLNMQMLCCQWFVYIHWNRKPVDLDFTGMGELYIQVFSDLGINKLFWWHISNPSDDIVAKMKYHFLKSFDVRGHLLTVLISIKRRALVYNYITDQT